MPEAAPLALLRTDIDRNPHRMKSVLMEPQIRKEILGGISDDEKKAVKAFVSQNGENALKTKPKVSGVSYVAGPYSNCAPFFIVCLKYCVTLNVRGGRKPEIPEDTRIVRLFLLDTH